MAILAALWLALIGKGPSWLSGPIVRWIAIIVPLYFILELFLFCLHWIFSSDASASNERSLAMFCVNLVELALLFSIVQILSDCSVQMTPWRAFYANGRAIIRLLLPQTRAGIFCVAAGFLQLVESAALLLVIIAGLAGTIVPEATAMMRPNPAFAAGGRATNGRDSSVRRRAWARS